MTPQDKTQSEEWCYSYKPLDHLRKQIRVLQVKPGTSDGLVESSVRHVSLLDDPVSKYEAASYVWSLVKGSATIVLDGKTISVPAAAEEVLRNFRRPDKERVLWIDAICINQRDLDERGHQVALMGEVYTKTARTLVWLGKADECSSKAFEDLEVIHRQVLAETDNCRRLREVLYGSTNIFQYSTVDLPKGLDFTAIRALFRRPWFYRRWVVQESALAPRGVFYWGEFSMAMLHLFRAAVWIHHKQHKLPFDLDLEGGMLNASYMSAYIDHEEGYFSARYGQKVYLADLFRYFRAFEVTDSRDCVYALLGLSGWASRNEPLPALLAPDYRKPLREILSNVTKMAISESGDLWLFRYIDHGHELTSQALQSSWVPNLFQRPDPKAEPNPMRSVFRANSGMGEIDQRTVRKKVESSTLADADVLSVPGLVADSVDAIGSVFDPECFEGVEGILAIVQEVLICRSLKDNHAEEALARLSLLDLGMVIVGGSCFDPQPTQGQMSQNDIFAQFIQIIFKIAKESQGHENGNGSTELKSILENPTFSRCVWAIKYACLNRRLFTTAKGRVGLGPQAIRSGDSLCVLSDSRLPIILRQLDTGWNVIGPCFAHGIMHGEAVKEYLLSGAETIDFDLR